MVQSSNQRLTLEEFLALPEGDITYEFVFHKLLDDDRIFWASNKCRKILTLLEEIGSIRRVEF